MTAIASVGFREQGLFAIASLPQHLLSYHLKVFCRACYPCPFQCPMFSLSKAKDKCKPFWLFTIRLSSSLAEHLHIYSKSHSSIFGFVLEQVQFILICYSDIIYQATASNLTFFWLIESKQTNQVYWKRWNGDSLAVSKEASMAFNQLNWPVCNLPFPQLDCWSFFSPFDCLLAPRWKSSVVSLLPFLSLTYFTRWLLMLSG